MTNTVYMGTKKFGNQSRVAQGIKNVLSNIYWCNGMHGVLPPNWNTNTPIEFTRADRRSIKESVVNFLLTEELDWTTLLIVVFRTEREHKHVSIKLTLNKVTLQFIGDKLKDIIERTIKEYIVSSEDPECNYSNLAMYGYFLAPSTGYDYDKMEPGLMEGMNNETEKRVLKWSDRIPYDTQDFLDSISKVVF